MPVFNTQTHTALISRNIKAIHCNAKLLNQPVNAPEKRPRCNEKLCPTVSCEEQQVDLLLFIKDKWAKFLGLCKSAELCGENLAFFSASNDCLLTVSVPTLHYSEILELHLLTRNYCRKDLA